MTTPKSISIPIAYEQFIKNYDEDTKVTTSYQLELEDEIFQSSGYGPGKKNFVDFYKRLKSDIGKSSCKISHYSDQFEKDKNYAGMIVYSVNNEFKWFNDKGKANGHRGRSFYIVVQCTDKWPELAFKEAKQGRVHDYLIKDTLGIEYNQDIVCCGGFSYHNGQMKYSSVWLNGRDQKGCKSDGNKYLSNNEKVLVDYCFEIYKSHGPGKIFELPDKIDKILYGLEN
ncbi:MAG: hypothetical protein GBAus27B_000553 [Mycoplasmataceae bacterium]|nr:MAG: hypothetical protein GBAus27B_000553 [Mycoplasmataceae bacterium]